MSTSNTSSPMDQNVFDPQAAAQARDRRKKVIENHWLNVTAKKKLSALQVCQQLLLVLHSLRYCLAVFWQKGYQHSGKPV